MGLKIIGEKEPLTWKEFEGYVENDFQSVKPGYSYWIYRGQSNSEWSLETSLERFLKDEELDHDQENYSAERYYLYLSAIVPAINSLTTHHFPQFDHNEISILSALRLPQYELLYFARHHGFPSPLLDWTVSYYIAAFFAFRHAKPKQNVAIFAYQHLNGGSSRTTPMINQLGPYVETHHRHYRQQGMYTFCCIYDNQKALFKSHELAIEGNSKNCHVRKFILKGEEKEEVLRKLFMMNINEYTLFGDDESLIRMLAFKEFHHLDFLVKQNV